MKVGQMVLMRNSARDGRKGDKLARRWLGPYTIQADIRKGLYRLQNTTTGKKGSERMQVSLYIIQNRPNMYPYQFIG